VLFGPADETRVDYGGGSRLPALPAPSLDSVRESLAILRKAERPVIIVGGGVRGAAASELLVAFAERTGIPVFSQQSGSGAMPADHPLNGFASGALAVLQAVNRKGPDAVLILGARRGMFWARAAEPSSPMMQR